LYKHHNGSGRTGTPNINKRKKINRTGHILRRYCLLKHVIEVKVEAKRSRGRRSKQLLGDLKEVRGFWKWKKEALCRAVWRTDFGRGYGLVVIQTAL
jgi:hypothetical protein